MKSDMFVPLQWMGAFRGTRSGPRRGSGLRSEAGEVGVRFSPCTLCCQATLLDFQFHAVLQEYSRVQRGKYEEN